MNKESINNYFISGDLALITALSLFYPIDSMRKENGSKKVWFSFFRDEQLDKFLETYWRGEVRVEPQAFFNQLRVIKSRIYSNDNSGNLFPVSDDKSRKLRR